MHLWVLTVAFSAVVYGISRISEPDLKAVNFAEASTGQRLNGRVIKEVEVDSEESCQFECVKVEERCKSVNFGTKTNEAGKHKCQLSDSDRFAGVANYTEDGEFIYKGLQSSCDNEPCLKGEKCLPVYEQNSYICEEGQTLPSPDGNWTAFWWYDVNTTWPSGENDTLAYDFGHCQASDPYCFGRLPLDAIEDSTEMLAVDSQGTQYKWSFNSSNPVAHAAWRALHDHQLIPYGEVRHARPAWNPEVLNGDPPEIDQDSFMYREEQGVKSVLLDDDGCDCKSTLSFGHALCLSGHNINYGPTGQYGVDALFDPNCEVPRSGIGLTLYYRAKP